MILEHSVKKARRDINMNRRVQRAQKVAAHRHDRHAHKAALGQVLRSDLEGDTRPKKNTRLTSYDVS